MSKEVQHMFASIAPAYDRTNSVLSLGIHHLWRKTTVKESRAVSGMHILDCATGTGDLAFEFKKAVGANGKVLGTDFCPEMMETGPSKSRKMKLHVDFEVADAMNLPYPDATFDIASISFGIRNVDDVSIALSEMARVVKPGGRVMILEFGQPNGIIGLIYNLYSNFIIPFIGGLLTGNKEAYLYLPRTAALFPCREDFLSLMSKTERYAEVSYKELTFGISFLYTGVVR
ncbi:MAG: bifunctional demethylmenaquinone methyltransferase/2-methoxy-6-polyprenyl-1,4-benzoquinol methylase UbiE [Ignavibacteria bacterium]|nr:bifunctional demethylmenaquinone methyltransferase/2-methoxy-6-polyprenyl-1,4-benzoquinol methylase UbiE [Ignavibacteria bacterium]